MNDFVIRAGMTRYHRHWSNTDQKYSYFVFVFRWVEALAFWQMVAYAIEQKLSSNEHETFRLVGVNEMAILRKQGLGLVIPLKDNSVLVKSRNGFDLVPRKDLL